MIRLESLSKTYRTGLLSKAVPALHGLTLDVRAGEIFGIVGPNGAGKSTTIKMLVGLVRPSGGRGTVDGHPIGSVPSRRRLGFLPENPALYEFLTGREYLNLVASLAQLDRRKRRSSVDALLELVGLSSSQHLRLRKFSKGMVQRLGLAQALLGDPALIVLDEPMSGLDPIGRKDVRDLIFRLRDEGRTVFFSTHILPDVEVICDRVALLSRGRLTDVGRLEELLSARVRSVEVCIANVLPTIADQVASTHVTRRQESGKLLVQFETLSEANTFVAEMITKGIRLEAFNLRRENLEELFMRRADEGREAAVRKVATAQLVHGP